MRISDWSSDVCSSDLFFSPVLVRKADHRNLDYAGEFAQCVFDFAGVDIFPAPDDHFFQPTCNPQIAVRVQRAQIAGTQIDRKSTRLNSSHYCASRMPSSALKKNKLSHLLK